MTANSITLTAKGVLTLPTLTNASELQVAPDATNTGGTIIISAASLIYTPGGLFLNADASSTSMGSGGMVSLTITGKQNLTFDFAPGWFISAQGSLMGGNGGNVSVSD